MSWRRTSLNEMLHWDILKKKKRKKESLIQDLQPKVLVFYAQKWIRIGNTSDCPWSLNLHASVEDVLFVFFPHSPCLVYPSVNKSNSVTWCHAKCQDKLAQEIRGALLNSGHCANSSICVKDGERKKEKLVVTNKLQDESRVILWNAQQGQWWPSRSATGAFSQCAKVLAPPQCAGRALRLRPKPHTTTWVSH